MSENIVIGSVDEGENNRFGPPIWSEQWQDFVMSQFTFDEKTAEGHPYVHGLRRVVRKLLGPILYCGPDEFQPVTYDAKHSSQANPVTSKCVLKLLWSRPEDGSSPYEVTFTDIADVMPSNTEPKFLKYPSAMASTRAESRCLRKALQIRKCAAEEISFEETNPASGRIKESDIIFLNSLCKRLNINVLKYINSGAQQYEKVEDMSYETSQTMMEHLSSYQNNSSVIPAKLKGYDPNWRN